MNKNHIIIIVSIVVIIAAAIFTGVTVLPKLLLDSEESGAAMSDTPQRANNPEDSDDENSSPSSDSEDNTSVDSHEEETASQEEAAIDPQGSSADAAEVARSYREILEANKDTISSDWYNICVYDICGDSVPELMYIIDLSEETRELHIWTYQGEAIEILTETVKDLSFEFGAIDFDVILTNDDRLYIRQQAGGVEWVYDIYYQYEYSESDRRFIPFAITASDTIKYIQAMDIFDGYSTEGWDNRERFNEQESEILSNIKNFLLSSNTGQRSLFMANAKQVFFYDNAIQFLNEMEQRGGSLHANTPSGSNSGGMPAPESSTSVHADVPDNNSDTENPADDMIENDPNANDASDFEYRVRTRDVIIDGYIGTRTDVVIPAVIEDMPVESIRESAFFGNKTITSVTIPDSVKNISDRAFVGCTALVEILLPDDVTFNEDNSFFGCTALSDATKERLLSINPDTIFE